MLKHGQTIENFRGLSLRSAGAAQERRSAGAAQERRSAGAAQERRSAGAAQERRSGADTIDNQQDFIFR